ncbi:MAG: class I SAM-dependent methyltransferase, partial [Candidatus Dadabacteria bacterium]|nr:class I SAM-dependent methyltransferase [Candidatus Dadabacteria bacterium]
LRHVNPVIGLKAGIKTCEMIEASGRSIRGSVILEIGTGWRINTPIALWLLGAERIITVDINPYLKPELVRDDLKYMSLNEDEIRALFGDRIVEDRFSLLLNASGKNLSQRELLELFHVEYKAPMDASALDLPERTVDYLISYNVFEHIPPEVIASILVEGRRVIRDDGLFVHRVDFSDHFAHHDKSIHFVNFLSFEDGEWDKIVHNHFMYMNRLRVDDMEELFRRSGLGIVSSYHYEHPGVVDLYKRGEIRLAEKYKHKSEHSVCTIDSWIIAEKPH